MATIKDVAQAAQVSAATVSRVLNKDEQICVSPQVRARIWDMFPQGSDGPQSISGVW